MGRNGARGGAGPSFRRFYYGFARIPLRLDALAVVSHEFRCVSTLPLWFRANSVAFRRSRCGFARIPLFRRSRLGFARIPLRFDARAVISREFRATAHAVGWGLRFDAPAVVSREFRCISMLPLWIHANSVAFRCSRCGFTRVPASSGVFWPLLGELLRLRAAAAHAVGRGLRFDAPAAVSREFRCVSTLPLWFRANSVAFRRSRCGFARIPACSGGAA